jgi:hypothetical protein
MASMIMQELGTERKGDIWEKRSVTHGVFLPSFRELHFGVS